MSEYRDSYEIIEAAADALDQAAADAELMPGPFEAAVSKDKGGGSAPTEDPNTLQSRAVARVIDLISEGPIVGLYTGEGAEGKDNPLKAVYFNNIPVMDSTGSLNYEGLTMEERTGLPDQAVIPDFPEVESEITVNQQVEDASPVLFIIADDDVDSIRLKLRIPALYEQVSSGSLVASTLQFTVKVQPFGGSFTTVIDDTVTGKNTSIYERQHKISLGDKGAFPLTFKVERVTADSDKASKQQDLFVNSYTEIQEAQLTYPDSALVAIAVDSELFSGRVPQRSFFVRGLIIQVPSNYFPETGLYHRRASDGADMGTDQIWDGTLYSAWSNNPAWVLFDILTNERYGLGEFIDDVDQVDRFALYEIGVYCDELVDTGLGDGTQERRFVFNGVINTREDAYDVVNAITSTFRGMSYWSSAGVTAVADSPKDPKRVITRANITGDFNYSGTALRTQHSAALVSYNDPTNNYKQTIEVVEDPVRRERYGWRELEVVAFGTTSRGQAYRLGRFILFSEERENETLTFTGTFDVSDLRPGDVINVADPARQGLRAGGRIISYTAGSPGVIVLDAEIDASDGDTLLVRTVEGGMESIDIEGADLSSTVTLKERSAIVNFVDSNPDTIVRTDGGSWIDDGVLVNNHITISDAAEAGNNATFVVDVVTASTLTLTVAGAVTADTADTITYGIVPTANLQVNSVFLHRGIHLVPETWRILSVREAAPNKWEFACLTYDESKFDAIEANIFLEAPPTSFLPSGPLLPATGLTVFESLDKVGSAVNVVIDISWTRSTDPRATFYMVEFRFKKLISDNDSTWQILPPGTTAGIHAVVPNGEHGFWSFRVTAMNGDGVSATSRSAPLVLADQEIIGKTAPPPGVENLTAVRRFTEVVLDWDDVDDIDLAGYIVRRGSAWDAVDVETLANPVFASTYTATVPSAADHTYHVRAVDTLGNVSNAVASIMTSIEVLPAVLNLYAYQVGEEVRVTWDGIEITENVQYEIRFGPTTSTLVKSNLFERVASPAHQGPMIVEATTAIRFYVRPFVTVATGSKSYGAAASFDLTVYPILNGFRVLSRTEETGWSSLTSGAAAGWLAHNRDPDFTATEGTSFDITLDSAATPEISDTAAPTFHCNLTVNSVGTAEGLIFGCGADNGPGFGMLACFDSAGDMIIRAGVVDPILPQLANTSNMLHQWNLFEVSGTREDDFGSNDLTVNGDVGSKTLADSTTMGACADFSAGAGAYLRGSTASIAGSDWTLSFRYVMDPSEDYSGQVFGMGGLTYTISCRFFESGQTFQIEVSTTGGQEILTVNALDGSLAATTRVVIWYVESTKTLSCELRNSDRDDAYGLVTASKVLLNSIQDETGNIDIGNSPNYVAETFYGQLGHFVFLDRAVTSDERWDLHHHVANTGSPRLVIPKASIPTNTPIDLVWKLNKGDASTAASIDAWLNGTLYQATDPVGHRMPVYADFPAYDFLDDLGPNRWQRSGVDDANYDKTWTGIFDGEAGNFDTALNSVVTLNSDLSYWRDENVLAPLEIVSDALTLTAGTSYAAYDFPFVLPTEKTGRLWYESTANTIAGTQMLIADATMQIANATQQISGTVDDVEPQISFWIDIDDTGTFIPFQPGTYRFTTATVRAVLQRGENETTRPSLDNLSVYFTEQPPGGTLQASTTDATPTVMTFDGEAASSANILTIPDDFSTRVTGRLLGRSTAGDVLELDFVANLQRGTGAASTTVTYSLTEYERTVATWVVEILAETTIGGLSIRVTGVAATDIEWVCDIDSREVG